jgi:hypothetical protein
MTIDSFEKELLKAEKILNTEFSFDLAEPSYLSCLEIITNNAHLKSKFESSIINLFDSKKLSDEPVAYLMFKLRWSGVKSWAEAKLGTLENPAIEGDSLQKVLDAFCDDWDNQDFYRFI